MTVSRQKKTILYALLVACGLAGTAFSASAATREEQTAACKGDALKFCTLAIPNEKKIASCLAAKRDRISPACRAFFPAKKDQHGRAPHKK